MIAVCKRCGKVAHVGKCTFEKAKKSKLEDVLADVDELKKKK